MSTPVWCELVCRTCAGTIAGRFVYAAVPRRRMKAIALAAGWQFLDDDVFCSPVCVRWYREQQQKEAEA